MLKKTNTLLSFTIDLPQINDDAFITFGEEHTDIPFLVKRFYYIYKIKPKTLRGLHAHKKTLQMLFCIQGMVKITLDNGRKREEIILARANRGVFLNKMMWHEMSDFSEDAILLVLASEPFEENDYIRDYNEFKKLSKENL